MAELRDMMDNPVPAKDDQPADTPVDEFREELERLINRHSMENGSDTPYFVLAQYLVQCLIAFDGATKRRDEWYGRISLSKTIGQSEDGPRRDE